MTSKTHFLLLLALVACANVVAQDENDLAIPVENDNQFPPDKENTDADGAIEGSGVGVIAEPDLNSETTSPLPELEGGTDKNNEVNDSANNFQCPKPCVCNIEGDSDFIVACSDYGLTEFPSPIDSRTTVLNVQNNKLTEIPKEVSAITNLKVLNAANNNIKDLSLGSISELPNLTILNLANNRLVDYPTDLKNSFSLLKLEELDLGSNDMRTDLSVDNFVNFKSLRKLTLPSPSSDIIESLCATLKDSLKAVCAESCNNQSYDCAETQLDNDDLLEGVIPGAIAFENNEEDNSFLDTNLNNDITENAKSEPSENDESFTTSSPDMMEKSIQSQIAFSSAIANDKQGVIFNTRAIVEVPKDNTNETEKVGATTSNAKTGGVDRSVIGIIVAGMVVIVAGITIKKNWSSISNRFSSNPSDANPTAQTNGTAPEEVPLQDKSPV